MWNYYYFYTNILSHNIDDIHSLKNQLQLYTSFIFTEIYQLYEKHYETLGINKNQIERKIQKEWKNSLINSNNSKKMNLQSIQKLVEIWKNILYVAEFEKYKLLFSNYDASKFRYLFSENHIK